jgi:amino acid permease
MIQLSIYIFIIVGLVSLFLLKKQSLKKRIAFVVIISLALIALLLTLLIMNGDRALPGSTRVNPHEWITEPVDADNQITRP